MAPASTLPELGTKQESNSVVAEGILRHRKTSHEFVLAHGTSRCPHRAVTALWCAMMPAQRQAMMTIKVMSTRIGRSDRTRQSSATSDRSVKTRAGSGSID